MRSQLRPHQVEVLEKARKAIQQGKRRPLIQLGTGLGKTYLAVAAVRGHVEKGGEVVWVAHRDELVEQARESLGDIPAKVATIQTLLASGDRPRATMLVLDEARHYVSPEWRNLPSAYPEAILLGLDATPARADGVGMGHLFNALITGISVKESIKRGLLVPCEIITTAKPLQAGQIAQLPVEAYVANAMGRKAVCFAPNVAAGEQHVREFRVVGLRSELVTGEMPAQRRKDILAEFKRGSIDCVVNVFVLTDGWDSPICDCIILARRAGTAATYLQMVGRGLRPYPGKTNCLLLDLTGTVHVHGTPEEDRIYSLEGLGIRRASEVGERYCQICGVILGPTDSVCPDCGREPEELKPAKVTGEKLTKFVYRPRATDEEKLRKLKGWFAVARQRGYKPGWPLVRFAVEFGYTAPGHMIKEAQRAATESKR